MAGKKKIVKSDTGPSDYHLTVEAVKNTVIGDGFDLLELPEMLTRIDEKHKKAVYRLRMAMLDANRENANSFHSLSSMDSFLYSRIDSLEDMVSSKMENDGFIRRELNSRMDDYELAFVRQRKRLKMDRLVTGLVIFWNVGLSLALAYAWGVF